MQTFLKQRATETGDIACYTAPVDVSEMSLLVFQLIVYSIAGGGSETITGVLQTSDDLETWDDVTNADVARTTAGVERDGAKAGERFYGRYVRFKVDVTGGTTSVEYSLVLNTFANS